MYSYLCVHMDVYIRMYVSVHMYVSICIYVCIYVVVYLYKEPTRAHRHTGTRFDNPTDLVNLKRKANSKIIAVEMLDGAVMLIAKKR